MEQKRLGIPREVPVAVQQWQGLIAINYAARARGITRHMRVQEALARCPELQCVHVQTIGAPWPHPVVPKTHVTRPRRGSFASWLRVPLHVPISPWPQGPAAPSPGPMWLSQHAAGTRVCAGAGGAEEDTKDRAKQKACLERYRRACWDILAVLHKEAPQVLITLSCPFRIMR